MVIVLSLEESEREIVAGFPEFIILNTNIPATIFFTLDGTEPTPDSEIFVNRIWMPTDGLRRTLKAVAIVDNFSSAILEKTYFTDLSNLNKTRNIGKEGINVLPANEQAVVNLGFDGQGLPARGSIIPVEQLDLIASTTNQRGEDISGDSSLDFINFGDRLPVKPETQVSYLKDSKFDPRAFYIIIDGSTPEALQEQTIRVINRPQNTMDLHSSVHNRNLESQQLISSNFVRYMISPKTGKMTFYYRDSRENRWIQSTQKIEKYGLNLSKNATPPDGFVFRWIQDRTQSRIY